MEQTLIVYFKTAFNQVTYKEFNENNSLKHLLTQRRSYGWLN
ncbi:hypothetical protein EV08_1664 [Prochlorococcus marinus str. SS2]|nr:hypothetical protein EV08_1664 [Prochlorococcus marinus str. SS2]